MHIYQLPNRVYSFIIIFVLGISCTGSQAFTQPVELFLVDTTSGCLVHNPMPSVYTSVRFAGTCTNDSATGEGKAVWYIGSSVAMEYEGSFTGGRMHGKGAAIVHDGFYSIEGTWENGYPVACTAAVYPAVEVREVVTHDEFQRLDKEALIDLAALQSRTVYPIEAKMRGQQGKVMARLPVSANGQIVRAIVEDEKWPNSVFVLSALNAIFQPEITARPAINQGQAVPMWLTLPIVYKLR